MRGEVYIAPIDPVPDDGSMIDPATARFWASWQAEGEHGSLEDIELGGAEAAIAWGRERSETVLIRLGSRGDTYFSAGVVPAKDDERPIPAWPPAAPPLGGWWQPPTCPTLDEIDSVKAELTSSTLSVDDAAAWAADRIRPAIEQGASDEIQTALIELAAAVELQDPRLGEHS